MSDHRHLVPRQVTTRLEFMPGLGLRELGVITAGALLGYAAYRTGAALHLGSRPQIVLAVLPPAAAYLAVKGGAQSLAALATRARVFLVRPKRLLFRQGSGGGITRATPGKPGSALLDAVLQLFPRRQGTTPGPQLPRTVQQWLPVQDIAGGVIHRCDGGLVAALRVEPTNLSLLTATEQQRILGAVHEAINALQYPAQVLSLARPLDLDGYLRGLEAQMRDVDPARQRLLRLYIRYVGGLVTAGDAQERRYYVLVPHVGERVAPEEVRQRAHDLAARLRQADMSAAVLDDRELLDLLHVWSHPAQAAYEPAPGGPPACTTLTRLEV